MKTTLMSVSLLLTLIVVGCDLLGLDGGTIYVSGQPFDLVILQLDSAPAGACCPHCVVSAPVPLDSTGSGSASGLTDGDGSDALWFGTGLYSGCGGNTSLACSGTSSFLCLAPSGNVTPYGTLTVSGPGPMCRQQQPPAQIGGTPQGGGGTLCNGGQVSVTINGSTVSTTYGQGSTLSSVASGLAYAINANPQFAGILVAGASSNVVTLGGPGVPPENAAYYPWSASCTYDTDDFSACGFRAGLSPLATMGTRPPL